MDELIDFLLAVAFAIGGGLAGLYGARAYVRALEPVWVRCTVEELWLVIGDKRTGWKIGMMGQHGEVLVGAAYCRKLKRGLCWSASNREHAERILAPFCDESAAGGADKRMRA